MFSQDHTEDKTLHVWDIKNISISQVVKGTCFMVKRAIQVCLWCAKQ